MLCMPMWRTHSCVLSLSFGDSWRSAESIVAHAPSNVKDDAAGKSFTFIAIVMRNAMGTLVRAPFTLV
jgi:hypothetical protein